MTTSTGRSRRVRTLLARFRIPLVLLTLFACQDRSFTADLSSSDTAARIRAIEFLGTQRDRAAITHFLEALQDSVVEVQAKAAWALGMVQAKEAVVPIVAMLSHEEARVRQSASLALLQIEEPEAIEPLKAAILVEQDDWVRQDMEEAIEHLKQFEGESDIGEASFR